MWQQWSWSMRQKTCFRHECVLGPFLRWKAFRPFYSPPKKHPMWPEMDTITLFTERRSYASAVLGVVILSVRLSVCLSVCLSHACFVTNPKNLPAILYTIRNGNPSSFLPRNRGVSLLFSGTNSAWILFLVRKIRLKSDLPPFKHAHFTYVWLHSGWVVADSKKV